MVVHIAFVHTFKMAKSSNEILMQCLTCAGKKLNGISCKRFQSKAQLSDQERSDIHEHLGFCVREQCCAVRQQVRAYPQQFKEKFDVLFNDYFRAIDAYYHQTLSRAEFIVVRACVKRTLTILRCEVDIYRANILADNAENIIQSGEQLLEGQSRKRRRVDRVDKNDCDASGLVHQLQVLTNNYMTHMRQIQADPLQAKKYWTDVLKLPGPLFDEKMRETMPFQFVTNDDFVELFNSLSTP